MSHSRRAKSYGPLLVLLAVLAVVALWSRSGPVEDSRPESPVPASLHLKARFASGGFSWSPWSLELDARGVGRLEWSSLDESDFREESREFRVSEEHLAQLVEQIRQARLWELKESYSRAISHSSTHILEVQLDGEEAFTRVYAPGLLRGHPEVERFLSVWNLLLETVPLPNPEQEPFSPLPDFLPRLTVNGVRIGDDGARCQELGFEVEYHYEGRVGLARLRQKVEAMLWFGAVTRVIGDSLELDGEGAVSSSSSRAEVTSLLGPGEDGMSGETTFCDGWVQVYFLDDRVQDIQLGR